MNNYWRLSTYWQPFLWIRIKKKNFKNKEARSYDRALYLLTNQNFKLWKSLFLKLQKETTHFCTANIEREFYYASIVFHFNTIFIFKDVFCRFLMLNIQHFLVFIDVFSIKTHLLLQKEVIKKARSYDRALFLFINQPKL